MTCRRRTIGEFLVFVRYEAYDRLLIKIECDVNVGVKPPHDLDEDGPVVVEVWVPLHSVGRIVLWLHEG